jgi:hypothetical protein
MLLRSTRIDPALSAAEVREQVLVGRLAAAGGTTRPG